MTFSREADGSHLLGLGGRVARVVSEGVGDLRSIPCPPGSAELAEGLVEETENGVAITSDRRAEQGQLLGCHLGHRRVGRLSPSVGVHPAAAYVQSG